MGIVIKQTSKNIFTISIALIIGGVNTLYFYPEFLQLNLTMNSRQFDVNSVFHIYFL